MKVIILILSGILFGFVLGCGGNSERENLSTDTPWIGTWQMVGYDSASVEDSNTVLTMKLDEKNKIEYITKTRDGEILIESVGEYSINDQHSVLTILEDGRKQTEYFIRKVDEDSLIFQSDKFRIKWKRID
jgi:hypothetical protein